MSQHWARAPLGGQDPTFFWLSPHWSANWNASSFSALFQTNWNDVLVYKWHDKLQGFLKITNRTKTKLKSSESYMDCSFFFWHLTNHLCTISHKKEEQAEKVLKSCSLVLINYCAIGNWVIVFHMKRVATWPFKPFTVINHSKFMEQPCISSTIYIPPFKMTKWKNSF